MSANGAWSSRTRRWVAWAVICAGGCLPGTCMIRTRDALVGGTKTFLAQTLLNPDNLADLPFDDVVSDLTGP